MINYSELVKNEESITLEEVNTVLKVVIKICNSLYKDDIKLKEEISDLKKLDLEKPSNLGDGSMNVISVVSGERVEQKLKN